jgi:hypothetical protein
MILGTIKSRVQTVNFNQFQERTRRLLDLKGVDKKEAENISFFQGKNGKSY